MDVKVVMLDGQSRSVRVNPHDTVLHLKRLIQGQLGISPERQKLIFVNGQRVTLDQDSLQVSQYGLHSGCQVSLLVTEPAPFQVFVRNLQRKSTPYDIKPDETVDHLKKRVESREGVPVSQQRLVYQSRDMMDGTRLSEYDLTPTCTIELTSRLRGGKGPFPLF